MKQMNCLFNLLKDETRSMYREKKIQGYSLLMHQERKKMMCVKEGVKVKLT